MMTLEQIRLKQNPVLTSILLGMGQGSFVAEFLFPRLPQALRGATIASMGNEKQRRYNLRRAPGSNTKRIEVKWEGNVYVVDQHSVEVPIPRELIQEQQASQSMNVAANGSTWLLNFDDWMYLQDETHLFNKTEMKKLGVTVATVTLFFTRKTSA